MILKVNSLLVVIVMAASCVDLAQAPFPADHPFNPVNPYIEPWWNRLTQDERKAIYAKWTPIEPLATAFADFTDAKVRAKMSLFRLLKLKADHLKAMIDEKQETLEQSNDSVIYDQEAGTYKTPQLIAQEQKQAEKQAFLFWNQAAQSAKRAVFLEKLRLLTNKWPNLKGSEILTRNHGSKISDF